MNFATITMLSIAAISSIALPALIVRYHEVQAQKRARLQAIVVRNRD